MGVYYVNDLLCKFGCKVSQLSKLLIFSICSYEGGLNYELRHEKAFSDFNKWFLQSWEVVYPVRAERLKVSRLLGTNHQADKNRKMRENNLCECVNCKTRAPKCDGVVSCRIEITDFRVSTALLCTSTKQKWGKRFSK